MGGEHGQARVLEGDQAHEHVAVGPLTADLLGVDAGRLVAVVAVGDQQLGVSQHLLHRGDRRRVLHAAEAVDGAVVVGGLRPQLVAAGAAQRRRRRRLTDRRTARRWGRGWPWWPASGAAGPRAGRDGCAREGGCGRARTPPRAPARRSRCACAAVRRVRCSPGRASTARAASSSTTAPSARQSREQCRRAVVAVLAALGQVDAHDVVRRARLQRGALGVVDDVVGRGDDVLQAAGAVEVVAQRADRLDLCHRRRPRLTGRSRGPARPLITLGRPRGVAQPGSAPALGAGGPRFKSGRPDDDLCRHAQDGLDDLPARRCLRGVADLFQVEVLDQPIKRESAQPL